MWGVTVSEVGRKPQSRDDDAHEIVVGSEWLCYGDREVKLVDISVPHHLQYSTGFKFSLINTGPDYSAQCLCAYCLSLFPLCLMLLLYEAQIRYPTLILMIDMSVSVHK